MGLALTNSVHLVGTIEEEFQLAYEKYGRRFYKTKVNVPRLSGNEDVLPVIVPEELIDLRMDYIDSCATIEGQFRSLPLYEKGRKHLSLYVYAKSIWFSSEPDDECSNNIIRLDGTTVESIIARKTLKGKDIADVRLSVERVANEFDFIPCVAWGRNAVKISGTQPDTKIQLSGRIQSRNYNKRLSNGVIDGRTAYEVSITVLNISS